jgi:hypothetical protein
VKKRRKKKIILEKTLVVTDQDGTVTYHDYGVNKRKLKPMKKERSGKK